MAPIMPASTEFTILKTLLYFDIFDYPLTKEDILQFSDSKISPNDLDVVLKDLIIEKKIWKFDRFYSLQNNSSLEKKRKDGNERAFQYLNKAVSIVKTLSQFPYVRAIGISGSVSKYFADENADIDYFIITHPNRLWIARTFMHLYKKLPFIKDRKRFYCMNYFVDESQLQIEEQNIYTATELVTLIPMYGNGSIENLYDANQWAFSFFPNFQFPDESYKINPKDNLFKRVLESVFNTQLGNWLDNYFFRLTTKRWKLKEEQKRLNTKGERMGLKTSKHFSKPNPIFFHNEFMNNYELKTEELKDIQAYNNQQKQMTSVTN